MPFGLKNAPSVFQRFIHNIFRDLTDKGLIVIYMDDLLLTTKDLEEHQRLLKIILNRMTTTAKAVQSCLGLFSYFRRFVPQFSRIAKPLQDLIRKDAFLDFNQDCYNAFCELRNRLIASPVLVIYNPTKVTELHTDAS